jgi:hypothetical protein
MVQRRDARDAKRRYQVNPDRRIQRHAGEGSRRTWKGDEQVKESKKRENEFLEKALEED